MGQRIWGEFKIHNLNYLQWPIAFPLLIASCLNKTLSLSFYDLYGHKQVERESKNDL